MLVDSQIKESFARQTPLSVSLVKHDCCNDDAKVRQFSSDKASTATTSLVCPKNWQGRLIPREFVDLTLAFHAAEARREKRQEDLC
ncbi:hypothetical protein FLL45_02220 [Aliikangiella marina]|uniref:Uncharacterized protein n=1 Tax=Aliikangiella marina TaxID=1712262 RepID=A0A545THU3_9GAMM|nr:hypothetical protein [Aliikangiella marina]TQV76793.1 hypothetical protein FLL45_02220 [Aliikangiella marina]